jgi:hypothetical protein
LDGLELMRRLAPLAAGELIDPPAEAGLLLDGKEFGGAATVPVSFRAAAWAAEYVRSHRGGASPTWLHSGHPKLTDWSMEKVLYFLRDQRKHGFMSLSGRNEQLCPDPHINFWVSAVLAIRQGAKEFGHKEVYDFTSWWLKKIAATWKSGMTPAGDVFMVGAMSGKTPHTVVGSLIIRELLGIEQPTGVSWGEMRYTAARLARQMIQSGDDFGGAARDSDLPFMRVPVAVFRYDGGHLVQADDPGQRLDLHEQWCSWVQVEYHEGRRSEVTFGLGWRTDPPLPPPAIKAFFQSPLLRDV